MPTRNRRQALIAMRHQQMHQVQPGIKGECLQCGKDFTPVHISTTHVSMN